MAKVQSELVSVIVVCYNEAPDRVHDTLSSIVNQDYPNVEIVVIDGGSDEKILRSFQRFKDQIACFISEPDEGIFDAMNKGVLRAKGEWVIFMNIGDRFWSSDSLSDLLFCSTEDHAVLYGDVVKEISKVTQSPSHLNGYVFYSRGICHQALLARRSLFKKVGLLDTSYKLCADGDWIYRAYKSGTCFKYIPVVVSSYEGGGASSDYKTARVSVARFRRRNFSFIERCLYGFFLFSTKIYSRLIHLDFAVPVLIRDYIRGTSGGRH
jgi:glycosyltransferase involved in cell wall biosynthesis